MQDPSAPRINFRPGQSPKKSQVSTSGNLEKKSNVKKTIKIYEEEGIKAKSQDKELKSKTEAKIKLLQKDITTLDNEVTQRLSTLADLFKNNDKAMTVDLKDIEVRLHLLANKHEIATKQQAEELANLEARKKELTAEVAKYQVRVKIIIPYKILSSYTLFP
jgi:ferritin-like protein